ncbi:MAG TPA: hypothetical protein VGU20_27430 [Stellaceae bacterium]|nr:hypothetical protein [Stellaceae bacterium]
MRAVVETQHRLDDALELVWQMNWPHSTAIDTARMLEQLQVDVERFVELSDRAGKYDGSPFEVFLDDGEPLTVCELLEHGDIGGLCAELLRELVALKVRDASIAESELLHSLLEGVTPGAPQQHADLETFRRIRFPDRPCSGKWLSFAAFQRMFRHDRAPSSRESDGRARRASPMRSDARRIPRHTQRADFPERPPTRVGQPLLRDFSSRPQSVEKQAPRRAKGYSAASVRKRSTIQGPSGSACELRHIQDRRIRKHAR